MTSRLRIRSPVVAFLAGLALYVLSIAIGSDLFPSLRSAAGQGGRALFPSLTVGGSAVLVSVLLFGVSMGLFVSIAKSGAQSILRALARVAKIETVGEAGLPRGVAVPRFMLEGALGRVSDRVSSTVSEQMVSAGVIGSPLLYVGRFMVYGVAAEILILPLSIFLLYLSGEPLVLLLNLAPGVFLLAPRLTVSSKLGDAVRGVEEELPHFAVFAAIAQSAGLSLYAAFQRVAGSGLFKWIEYEGLLIKRETTFFGNTQVGAIGQRALQHHSERFRSFLQGYASVLTSGGDITGYLESRAKEFLYWTEFKWKSYAESSSNVGEGIIALFFTLPLLILAAGFISPGTTLEMLGATIMIVVPVFGAVAYATITKMQPKTYDEVKGGTAVAVVAGAVAGAVGYLLTQQMWLTLAASAGVFSVVFGYSSLPQLRSIRKVEDALPAFVRDVTEYRKIGYDVTKAIQKLALERRYNRQFDVLLKDVSLQLDMGTPLKDVYVKTKAWLARMVFFMLGQIVETGGGTPQLLDSVNDFTQRMVTVKKETKSNMRLYEMLAYITPVGLALITALLYSIMQQFGGLSLVGQGSPLSNPSALPASFLDLTKFLVVEVAIVLAFLSARTVEFTNRGTIRIAVSVVIAVAAIMVSQSLVPALGLIKA